MKIFGNSRRRRRDAAPQRRQNAQNPRPAVRQSPASGEKKSGGLTGRTKGLILLTCSICVFLGVSVMCLSILYSSAAVAPSSGNRNHRTQVGTDPSQASIPQDENNDTVANTDDGVFNILICGTDGDGGRTDTIIVANLDTGANTVSLMSIPRDTYIYGNYYLPKINSVYGSAGMGEKGIQALRDKIGNTFGIWTDGYVMVNLEAFEKIVDMVGGVYVEVPMNMNYDDPAQDLYIHLQKGWQTLDGAHAIQLCRYRYGYATADIRRTEVQQDFLKALAKKCVETISLSQIPQYAKIFSEYVRTDLTIGNIIYFARRLTQCNFDDMYTVTLPGEGVSVNGGDYYELYPNATLKILNEHFIPDKNNPLTIYDLSIRQVTSSSSTEPEETTRRTEPAETTEPPETTEPTESTEKTEPTKPSESEKPTKPTTPSESSDQTEPTEPSDSSDAPEPTETEPTEPSTEPEPGPSDEPGPHG